MHYPHKKNGLVGELKMGENVLLSLDVCIDLSGNVEIGDHSIIGNGSKLFTHTHDFLEGYVPDITRERGVKAYNLRIGSNVYIGEEAMVLPQAIEIGDNAIIGARAVLTKNVGPDEIWAGNPARKIGIR